MAKYKEIVSMVLDMLKETSDDSTYNEGHIIFLAGRYRSFLLKQRYYADQKSRYLKAITRQYAWSWSRLEPLMVLPV